MRSSSAQLPHLSTHLLTGHCAQWGIPLTDNLFSFCSDFCSITKDAVFLWLLGLGGKPALSSVLHPVLMSSLPISHRPRTPIHHRPHPNLSQTPPPISLAFFLAYPHRPLSFEAISGTQTSCFNPQSYLHPTSTLTLLITIPDKHKLRGISQQGRKLSGMYLVC